jgi:chorismate synthase
MPGSCTGTLFRVVNFGESHGPAIGVVVDGCPAGVPFDSQMVIRDLNRRRPGQHEFSSDRNERDAFELLSGVFEGATTGTPIALIIRNKDARSLDYEALKQIYRPSHADYVYDKKFGFRDHRGGGRSSARMTAGTVMAGAIARMLLLSVSSIRIAAYVHAIGEVELPGELDMTGIENMKDVLNCPSPEHSKQMQRAISTAKKEGDSLGGQIKCIVSGMPVGLGEPIYEKLDAVLASSLMSINAVKAVEIGSGIQAAKMKGSVHNDAIVPGDANNSVHTRSNHSGGIQGGISNGENLMLTISFKPVASIAKSQVTVDTEGKKAELKIEGRHDPCVVPRAVAIVEAHVAIVLADMWLMNKNSKI